VLLHSDFSLLNSGYRGFGYLKVIFLLIEFPLVNKILVSFKFRISIILLTHCAHTHG
jgi:hypothetical protein